LSIAINPMPAASSSDDSAAPSAVTHNGSSFSLFESILDEQSAADEGTGTDNVGGADVPLDVLETAAPAAQTAIDSLAALLTASIPGTRPLLRKDEINQSVMSLGSIKKDKPAVDPSALLLLAAQNVVRQLDELQAPPVTDAKDAVATNAPIHPANNDELAQHLFAALTETEARAVLNADTDDAPLTTTATTSLTDLLIKASEQNPQADQVPLPDLSLPRTPTTTPPATGSLVDAIRLAIGQGAQLDQDRGFTQSSTAGFDRRGSKTAVVPAIHLEAGSFDAAVRASAPPGVPTVTLPNEDGVVSSIVQSMRLQMRDGVGTAVVHLEPDYLGAVSISLRIENGVVTASLHAENPQVRAWMEANTPLLRESLAGQGLSLDRLLVTDERIADEQSQGRRQQHEQEQQARQRPRRNEATTFEVIV
jgi:flagellar hook-length control protein FliK